MQLKTILLFSILLLSSETFAQDKIYTKDGGVYEAKIKEINSRHVIYKKWSNQNGPDYELPKSKVDRIKFENGEEEIFDDSRSAGNKRFSRLSKSKYGKNIFGFSPLIMTNVGPVGLGLSYERVLDPNNIVSFYLPVAYSFSDQPEQDYATGNTKPNERNMVWFYPGVKIFPTGSNGMIRYSVGPSLAFGAGKHRYSNTEYDPSSQSWIEKDVSESVFVMGILVNNALNVHPVPYLHLGVELGLGVPYYTNENRNISSSYNVFYDEPLVQFHFKIGYRF